MTDQNLNRSRSEANPPPVAPRFRALSLKQPWAWAVVHGPKWIENRTWFSELVGPIWIASSSQVQRSYYEEARGRILRIGEATGQEFEVPALDDLPRGMVVGRATVTDYILPGGYWCQTNTTRGRLLAQSARAEFLLYDARDAWGKVFFERGELSKHPFASSRWHFRDQYGYVLDDRRALVEPVPCKGHQMAWTMKPALVDEVLRGRLLDARPLLDRLVGQ